MNKKNEFITVMFDSNIWELLVSDPIAPDLIAIKNAIKKAQIIPYISAACLLEQIPKHINDYKKFENRARVISSYAKTEASLLHDENTISHFQWRAV